MKNQFIRRIVLVLIAGAGMLALTLALSQSALPRSMFEYGNNHEYRGVLTAWPYPAILDSTGARYWLVAPGKHGLPLPAAELSSISIRGALTERDRTYMVEAIPGTARSLATHSQTPAWMDLGEVTLRGQIVDSKCWLGVMNPGEGKVHRDCAVRCISGGLPPGFVIRDTNGRTRILMMTGSDGRPLSRELLDFVAEPIQATGHIRRSGNSLAFETEPSNFVRLSR